jgi:hypothetical protein
MFTRIVGLLMLLTVIMLFACSGSTDEDVPGDIFSSKTAVIVGSTDNPADDLPVRYNPVDSYSPCTISFYVGASSGSVNARIVTVEIAVDNGEWANISEVPDYTEPVFYGDKRIPPIGWLAETFAEPGAHVIDARVTFSDGDVIQTTNIVGEATGLDFTIYAHGNKR